MDEIRKQELHFLMRTNSAIPVTETRNNEIFQTAYYSDFYTIRELVEEGFMEYIGQQKEYVCLRAKNSFQMYINLEIKKIIGGELITIALTKEGRSEFDDWAATQ